MTKLLEVAIAKYILMYYNNDISVDMKIKTEKRLRHILYKAYTMDLIGGYRYNTYTMILPSND